LHGQERGVYRNEKVPPGDLRAVTSIEENTYVGALESGPEIAYPRLKAGPVDIVACDPSFSKAPATSAASCLALDRAFMWR